MNLALYKQKSTLDGMNTSGQWRHSAKFYAALKVIPKQQLHKCFQQLQHHRARCTAQENYSNCKCTGILTMKSQELNSHTSYTNLTTRKSTSDRQISIHVTHTCHLLFLQYHWYKWGEWLGCQIKFSFYLFNKHDLQVTWKWLRKILSLYYQFSGYQLHVFSKL